MIVNVFGGKTPKAVQQAAVEAAEQLEQFSDTCVATLIEALCHAEYGVRSKVRQLIPRLGAAAVPYLVQKLRDAENPEPLEPIWALRDLGPLAAPAIDILMQLLDCPTPGVCNNIIRVLGCIGPAARALLPELHRRLPNAQATDGNPMKVGHGPFSTTADELQQRRRVIAESAMRIGGALEPWRSILIELLKSPCIHTRRDAIEALGKLGPDALPAVPALLKLLRDDFERMRHFAAGARPDRPRY